MTPEQAEILRTLIEERVEAERTAATVKARYDPSHALVEFSVITTGAAHTRLDQYINSLTSMGG